MVPIGFRASEFVYSRKPIGFHARRGDWRFFMASCRFVKAPFV